MPYSVNCANSKDCLYQLNVDDKFLLFLLLVMYVGGRKERLEQTMVASCATSNFLIY